MTEQRPRRGFAAMDPAEVRAIASAGGRAVQAAGTGHRYTSAEAAEAGRKGGLARQAKLRALAIASGSDDPYHEPYSEDEGPPTLRVPAVGSAA